MLTAVITLFLIIKYTLIITIVKWLVNIILWSIYGVLREACNPKDKSSYK